jgi:hypothetical protein
MVGLGFDILFMPLSFPTATIAVAHLRCLLTRVSSLEDYTKCGKFPSPTIADESLDRRVMCGAVVPVRMMKPWDQHLHFLPGGLQTALCAGAAGRSRERSHFGDAFGGVYCAVDGMCTRAQTQAGRAISKRPMHTETDLHAAAGRGRGVLSLVLRFEDFCGDERVTTCWRLGLKHERVLASREHDLACTGRVSDEEMPGRAAIYYDDEGSCLQVGAMCVLSQEEEKWCLLLSDLRRSEVQDWLRGKALTRSRCCCPWRPASCDSCPLTGAEFSRRPCALLDARTQCGHNLQRVVLCRVSPLKLEGSATR